MKDTVGKWMRLSPSLEAPELHTDPVVQSYALTLAAKIMSPGS